MKLFADLACWEFQKTFPDEFDSYGCGPGGVGDFFVPDTVYFLSIRAACRIHDWGYRHSLGASDADRKRHDRILLNNSLRIVHAKTNWRFLLKLRIRRCRTYYQMVRAFGGPAYWEERNKENRVHDV